MLKWKSLPWRSGWVKVDGSAASKARHWLKLREHSQYSGVVVVVLTQITKKEVMGAVVTLLLKLKVFPTIILIHRDHLLPKLRCFESVRFLDIDVDSSCTEREDARIVY